MKTYTCLDIAKYFLAKIDEETEGLICNLKLQKLVYYAQGFNLAIYDKPLFAEQIEAWAHGPVVPSLYQQYKSYGAAGIPVPDNFDNSIYDEQTRSLLDSVYNAYGQFAAWKLRNMTHEESPWKDVYEKNPSGVITNDALKAYFKTQIEQ